MLGQRLHHPELGLEVRLEEDGVRLRCDAGDEVVDGRCAVVVPRGVEEDGLVREPRAAGDLEVVDGDTLEGRDLAQPALQLRHRLVLVARHHPHGGKPNAPARPPGWCPEPAVR